MQDSAYPRVRIAAVFVPCCSYQSRVVLLQAEHPQVWMCMCMYTVIELSGSDKVERPHEMQRMGKQAFSSKRWTYSAPHHQGLSGDHTELNHPVGK